MILVIGEKRYPSVAIDELSIRHTLALQRELATSDFTSAKTWTDVLQLLADVSTMTLAERQKHPEALFLTAVTIWAARVSAGEQLSLVDAVDLPAKAVRWVAEPADHAEPDAGKAQPRKPGAKRKTSAAT